MPRKKKEDDDSLKYDEDKLDKTVEEEEAAPILLQRVATPLKMERIEAVRAPGTSLREDLNGVFDSSKAIEKNHQEMLEKMKGDHDQKRVIERFLNDINRNVRDIQAVIDREKPTTAETRNAVNAIKTTLKNLSIIHKIMIAEGPDDEGLRLLKDNVQALPTQINALRSGGELQMMATIALSDEGWSRMARTYRGDDQDQSGGRPQMR